MHDSDSAATLQLASTQCLYIPMWRLPGYMIHSPGIDFCNLRLLPASLSLQSAKTTNQATNPFAWREAAYGMWYSMVVDSVARCRP